MIRVINSFMWWTVGFQTWRQLRSSTPPPATQGFKAEPFHAQGWIFFFVLWNIFCYLQSQGWVVPLFEAWRPANRWSLSSLSAKLHNRLIVRLKFLWLWHFLSKLKSTWFVWTQVSIWSAAANTRNHLQPSLHCWNGWKKIWILRGTHRPCNL